MKKSEKLKEIVREKYADIATESSNCCSGNKNKQLDYSVFNESYADADGYFKDADLNLGCGLPTEHANINIGDAVRTIGKNFQLYPNHARILTTFSKQGFTVLPEIIWRKPTNAPNKFMGSGMLPPSAYVTLEHEFILILRKGGKRIFKTEKDKINRRNSAYFWEERNTWFSDIWDLRGVTQTMLEKKSKELRSRSAAFPFELAYRLINMYSVKGDVILDPFLGTGTTTIAAMVSARNSIGFEIEKNLKTNTHGSLVTK